MLSMSELITKAIADMNAADRSDLRTIQNDEPPPPAAPQEPVTKVTFEQCPTPPKVYHLQTDPLPRRSPHTRREVQLWPDEEMVRKFKGLPPVEPKITGPIALVDMNPVAYANDLTDKEVRESLKDKHPNPEEFAANMPPMPEMEGLGRYRMSKNADKSHRLENLRRSTTNLVPEMIKKIGELDLVDKDAFEELASERSSDASSLNSASYSPGLYFDARRGSIVQRGFSPSPLSSTVVSWGAKLTRQKSEPTGGEPHKRNLNPRSASIAKSELSTPLKNISQGGGGAFDTVKKIQKPCVFDDSGDADEAIASDDEDDWTDDSGPSEKSGLLSQSIRADAQLPAASRILSRPPPIGGNGDGSLRRVPKAFFQPPRDPLARVRNGPNRIFNQYGVDNVELHNFIAQQAERTRIAKAGTEDPGSAAVPKAKWEKMKAAAGRYVPREPVRKPNIYDVVRAIGKTKVSDDSDDEDDDGPVNLASFMVEAHPSAKETVKAVTDTDNRVSNVRASPGRLRSDTVIHHPSETTRVVDSQETAAE